MNGGKRVPSNGIIGDQKPEEHCDISKFIRLVSMDGSVVCFEGLFERFLPIPIEITEPFAHETIEFAECPFGGTTIDDHVDKFHLLPFLEVDLHELVTTFFEIDRRHDGQVNRTTEVD
jgi:hypothetical protein